MFKVRSGLACWLGAAVLAAGLSSPAHAQDKVKIGAIYPLSGNAASAGELREGGDGSGAWTSSTTPIPSSAI